MSIQSLLNTGIAGGAAGDQYFKNTTLLVTGDGTNGAQNSTFVDSSSQALTFARNGNVPQGTFTPYGSNWSVFFGSDSQAYFDPQSYFEFASGSNTIECWIYPMVASTDYNILIANPYGVNDSTKWGINITPSGYLQLYKAQSGPAYTSTNTINWNQWNHIALVTDISAGNTNASISFYINGSRTLQTGCDLSSYTYCGQTICFADRGSDPYSTTYDNWMSNFRWVRNASVYTTSTITVPTAPLTAITDTKLLTLQSNRLIDNSGNNLTITPNGCKNQRFSPFTTRTPYSASTIGGSGYFDANGDWLQASNVTSSVYYGDYDFTIECWAYVPTAQTVFLSSAGQGAAGYNHQFTFDVTDAGQVQFSFNQGNGGPTATANGFKFGSWNHVAVVRNYSANTIVIYINGVGTTTTSVTGNGNAVGYYYDIGIYFMNSATSPMLGYITDYRQVKHAVYSGNFTPPIAPLAISGTASAASYSNTANVNTTFSASNTQILLNMTDAGIIDNAMMSNLETVYDAKISTSVKKYGTGSIVFDGTGDWLAVNTSKPYELGSSDFTFEGWVNLSDTTNRSVVYWNGESSGYAALHVRANSGQWALWMSTSGGGWAIQQNTLGTASTGVWTHVAVVRNGTNLKLFINGSDVTGGGYTLSGSLMTSYSVNQIGTYNSGYNTMNGYIDDIRLTKGVARYTGTFTPPTKAHPTKGS